MKDKKTFGSPLMHIITPIIIAAICLGTIIAASIKPYDKAKVYLHLAFMDDSKIDPANKNTGMTIRDNKIISGYSGEIERGACQATSSAVIGDKGNTVISAHVDTYFSDLGGLDVGDTVTLNTNYGEFTYTVREKIEFKSKDKSYIVPKKEDLLTLYTCKKDVFGSSDKRFGVVCELTERKFYVGEGAEN